MLGVWGKSSLPPLHDPSQVRVVGKIRKHQMGDEIITIDLEIENTQTGKGIPPFAMTFRDSTYWHLKRVFFSSGLAPLGIVTKTVELKCKFGVSRLDADRRITALVYHANAKEVAGREVFFEWTYQTMETPFRDYASEMPPDMSMTILLVGPSGAGKTALLRNLLTAGSRNRDIQRPGVVASFGEMVTHELNYHGVGDLHNVQIADVFGHAMNSIVAGEDHGTRGLWRATWQEAEIKHLFDGTLPPGWSIKDEIAGENRPALLDGQAMRRHIPTSFIHVIDARELDSDLYLDREAKLYKSLTHKAGYEGIIALTHIDRIVSEARQFPMETYPEIEELKARVASGMGVPSHTVYAVVSYTSERVRDYDIDRCSGVILEASMKQSLQFAKFHLDKRLRDFRDVAPGAAPVEE